MLDRTAIEDCDDKRSAAFEPLSDDDAEDLLLSGVEAIALTIQISIPIRSVFR